METKTITQFEQLTDMVREAQQKASTGHGTTTIYAHDALEGTNTDYNLGLNSAKKLLEIRKREVELLEKALTDLEANIAEGGMSDYITITNQFYNK